jgi:hypothetical protein
VGPADYSLQASVAGLHAAFHSCRQHCGAGLAVGQCHAHRHQRSGSIRLEPGFDMVVRRRIGQVHALDMDDLAVGHKFQKFAGKIKAAALSVCPLLTNFAARSRFVDAHGHRPALGAEHPLLY